jgi:hypothetical protein
MITGDGFVESDVKLRFTMIGDNFFSTKQTVKKKMLDITSVLM